MKYIIKYDPKYNKYFGYEKFMFFDVYMPNTIAMTSDECEEKIIKHHKAGKETIVKVFEIK
jgi:hypothetical protein